MKRTVVRATAALALLAAWTFTPLGGMLRHPEVLVRLLTAAGLALGTATEWLVRYAFNLRLTRRVLTGAGWAASALTLIVFFRERLTPLHFAAIVAYAGALAWALRFLLGVLRRRASEGRHRHRGPLIPIEQVRLPGETPSGD